MNILIVDDNEMMLDLTEMYLESFFDHTPVLANSGNSAISIIQEGFVPQLIISDFNMAEGTGGDLFNYYQSEKIDSFFALISAENFDALEEFKKIDRPEKIIFIQKPYDAEQFEEAFKDLICEHGPETIPINLDKPKFMKVKIKKFLQYMNCSVDVYLKLSDDKTIKISNRFDRASSEQLNRYLNKGAEYIFLTFDDFKIFVETGMTQVNIKLKESSGVILIDSQKDAVENIHEALVHFGVSSKTIETASNCFEATLKTLKKNDGIKDLLPSFKKGDDNFKYSLSVASSYFSVAMGLKVSFCDTSCLEKLSMAALFQDISLTEPAHVRITSLESESYQKLSKRERDLVFDHSNESVKLIDKCFEIPTDVKNIILQHHERPNQAGFPRALDSNSVSPLSCVFILAHELSNSILSEDEVASNINFIRTSFQNRYNKGNFKKVFSSFSDVFKNLK